MEKQAKPHLVVIVGPTAVGKTAVSIELAKKLGGEIVSADSRLFYKGMDIGTAKPTLEEMAGVPHHMIDVAEPDQPLSLAVFQRKAYLAIDDIIARGKRPMLVGGTGQYIRAIIEGWHIPPLEPDNDLRDRLNQWAVEIGPEAFHERLKCIDPEAAANIDHRNVRRVVRALEVIFKTGERFSELRRQQACPYRTVLLGLTRTREDLYQRIDRRIELMLEQGLVHEVRTLLDHGYSPDLPTLSAIGYAEIIQFLQGEVTLEEAVMLIKRNTRIFVRHQANWFKSDDPRITWFEVNDCVLSEMENFIRKAIENE